jgi:hypothetical protein
VKVSDNIIRKDNIISASIEPSESDGYRLRVDTDRTYLICQEYETLKMARYALNKLHRDLEGEIDSW